MSDRPTPETDQQSIRMETAKLAGAESVVTVDHARRLEHQRDAYAETLRLIAESNDRSHHEAAFTALIRNRHPELTP